MRSQVMPLAHLALERGTRLATGSRAVNGILWLNVRGQLRAPAVRCGGPVAKGSATEISLFFLDGMYPIWDT